MNFIDGLKKQLNQTKTLNGANALKTTDSALLDLFATIGASRNKKEEIIEKQFIKAYTEDQILAMKLLFYARDIRSGLGERRLARVIYKYLANVHTESLRKNLPCISEYGRWDDLLVLLDTPLYEDVIALIGTQLELDLASTKPSLLAKWLPSMNTSSDDTRKKAVLIAKGLHWNARKYRKTLSLLRKRIDVVEIKMSSRDWEHIDYSKVPSNAMNVYSCAFKRNDEKRFDAYIHRVKSGDAQINASVLYPYNIVEKILYNEKNLAMDVLEQQWNHLPDYIPENSNNILVMADVSGSMYGRPLATSVGLALYFAERAKGAFRNCFMTFSESPTLVQLSGDSLHDKVKMAQGSEWGMNTDFEKALNSILEVAKRHKMEQAELPRSLIVISDMQFDSSIQNTNGHWTFYQKMKSMYKGAGYKIPEIVFWNVNSATNEFQTSSIYEGVKMASGQSAAVFKAILESKSYTPYDFMLEVLNSERYEKVVA